MKDLKIKLKYYNDSLLKLEELNRRLHNLSNDKNTGFKTNWCETLYNDKADVDIIKNILKASIKSKIYTLEKQLNILNKIL